MKALTLHQPWAGLIIHGPKRVENRRWIPTGPVGMRFAIHAGLLSTELSPQMESLVCRWMHTLAPEVLKAALTHGAILGDVRFAGVIHNQDQLPENQRRFWVGPIGWLLDEVRALPTPIPCKGKQGLWKVPESVLIGAHQNAWMV